MERSMRSGRRSGVLYLMRQTAVFVFFAVICVFGGFVFGSENEGITVSKRYRVESLKYISADEGRKYLSEAGIDCTASSLPSPNTLLITAGPAELVKASALLRLVDAEQAYVIKTLT